MATGVFARSRFRFRPLSIPEACRFQRVREYSSRIAGSKNTGLEPKKVQGREGAMRKRGRGTTAAYWFKLRQ